MRSTSLAIAAALSLVFVAPASAASMTGVHTAQATDFAAAKKKKVRKGKAEKVEYMRAVPAK